MPDHVIPPTPEPTPRKWWEDFLPTNWRKIVAWLVLTLAVTGVNYVLKQTGREPLPLPPVPDFSELDFIVPNEMDVEPEVVAELDRRKVKVRRTGWRKPSPEETNATLRILQAPQFADTEAGQEIIADADAPVWRLAYKARGKPIPIRDQGPVGSCVSFGFAGAVEYTMAAQNAIGKQSQELPDIAQEVIYAGSRVEVNGGRVPFNGDGSTGAWGAKWLESTGGALARGKYGNIDLTEYSVQRAKSWGNSGVPNELEPLAKKHPAKCTMVGTAEEARKALSQGYAISVCSMQGFAKTRDSEGFAKASGSWAHCMLIAGYRADKPGFLIVNSWGPNWISGPKGKYDDTPDGSFWAEATVVDRMLKQGDSFAVANADGFRRRKLQPDDWIVNAQPRRPFTPMLRFGHVFPLAP